MDEQNDTSNNSEPEERLPVNGGADAGNVPQEDNPLTTDLDGDDEEVEDAPDNGSEDSSDDEDTPETPETPEPNDGFVNSEETAEGREDSEL